MPSGTWPRSAQSSTIQTWARELEEDAAIVRHIEAGHLVPITIGSDGAFCITLRSHENAMPALTSVEEQRVVVRSQAYRLSTSGRIDVSGIEYVGPVDHHVAAGELVAGEYDVAVHLMDYDDVPDRGDEHPDFLVTIGPRMADKPRGALQTFDPQR